MTKKERERERISKMFRHDEANKKKVKKKNMEDDEKAGRTVWEREEGRDLLRVFPPCVEGTAGPDLAVCRLAGSIVTLGGEEEQQEVKVKGHRKVRRTNNTRAVRRKGEEERRRWLKLKLPEEENERKACLLNLKMWSKFLQEKWTEGQNGQNGGKCHQTSGNHRLNC